MKVDLDYLGVTESLRYVFDYFYLKMYLNVDISVKRN